MKIHRSVILASGESTVASTSSGVERTVAPLNRAQSRRRKILCKRDETFFSAALSFFSHFIRPASALNLYLVAFPCVRRRVAHPFPVLRDVRLARDSSRAREIRRSSPRSHLHGPMAVVRKTIRTQRTSRSCVNCETAALQLNERNFSALPPPPPVRALASRQRDRAAKKRFPKFVRVAQLLDKIALSCISTGQSGKVFFDEKFP